MAWEGSEVANTFVESSYDGGGNFRPRKESTYLDKLVPSCAYDDRVLRIG